MARLRLAGFRDTGKADFSAEIGSGSTPRNWAGSVATDTAASPRIGADHRSGLKAARISSAESCGSSPCGEVAARAGVVEVDQVGIGLLDPAALGL